MDPTFQAHPIPQNVTNFEFHLVGDMTIKQFGYLAVGLGIAFLTFIGLATPFPFIAYPIMIISAATGAAFAFVPIQERPLDHWMAAFFKAIFQPTKLTYQSKILRKEDPVFTRRLGIYMKNKHADQMTLSKLPPRSAVVGVNPTAPATTSNLGAQRKPSMADRLLASNQMTDMGRPKTDDGIKVVPSPLSQPQPIAVAPAPMANPTISTSVAAPKELPKPADLQKTVELAKDAQETQAKILKIEKQLEQIKATVAQPGADAKYYVDQFQALLTDLQKLNEHASGTAHDLAVLANAPAPAAPATPPVAATVPTVSPAPVPEQPKIIPSVKLTSFPNVINGIVTDSQGNYVEGAVVVAHDKQGLPVRALRSNKLGQFVAATPLTNGTYILIVEKDNLTFDQISLELKNEILPPVAIAAKKQVPQVTA